MLRAIRQCCANADELYIFDARSNLAAGGNKLLVCRMHACHMADRAQGKGTESPDVYELTKIRFLDIANIHVVRASFDALRVRL
jgi:hypothetical protein